MRLNRAHLPNVCREPQSGCYLRALGNLWARYHIARPVVAAGFRSGVAAAGLLLLITSPTIAAGGFGYVVTGTPAVAQVIDPEGGGKVHVAWIENSETSQSVQVESFSEGTTDPSSRRTIFTSNKGIWSLKFESTPDSHRILCVNDGGYPNFATRIIRFDEGFQELGRVRWASNTNVLPAGRMLGGDGQLLLSKTLNSAVGRFVDARSLVVKPWFIIQLERDVDWAQDVSDYYDYNSEYWERYPVRVVTGCDTALAPDGTATAVYDFNGIHLRRFGSNGLVEENMELSGRPYTGFQKLAKTAVAVLDNQTTLLAWEWHDYNFAGSRIVMLAATPGFRAVLADGSTTPIVNLEPASTRADILDSPAVGLRPDGSGAVAWTVRTDEGSTVWLQRLDAGLEAFEPPRVVDARPGFDTDRPMVRGDDAGNLFLSWRCTRIEPGPSEIGILNLEELDEVPAGPRIRCIGPEVQLQWSSPPASRITLWYSPTLSQDDAVAICSECGISGPRTIMHQPDSNRGFYWLSNE